MTFLCDSKVLSKIDKLASEREISRSRLINKILGDHFAPQQPLTPQVDQLTPQVELLKNQLEHKDEIIAIREAEIGDLKELNGRLWLSNKECTDRLVQYQLPPPGPSEPKRGFWAKIFRRKPNT